MNLEKTSFHSQKQDSLTPMAEFLQKRNISTIDQAAELIYTTAYQDGYLEAQRDTIRLVMKHMLACHFDQETIQTILDVSPEEIDEMQSICDKQGIV